MAGDSRIFMTVGSTAQTGDFSPRYLDLSYMVSSIAPSSYLLCFTFISSQEPQLGANSDVNRTYGTNELASLSSREEAPSVQFTAVLVVSPK